LELVRNMKALGYHVDTRTILSLSDTVPGVAVPHLQKELDCFPISVASPLWLLHCRVPKIKIKVCGCLA
jgi:hypothetical protein